MWGLSSAAWAAIAAWLTLTVYLAILVYAVRQFGEARTLRRQQARPFVVVDFDVDWLTYITVENIGRTAAYGVRWQFQPDLSSTLSRPWAWEESNVFAEGIPMLPPGKQFRVEFDAMTERFASDLPMVYEVLVTYDGPPGAPGPYKDSYTLDLGIYQGSPPKVAGLPQLVDAVNNLQKTIKSWAYGSDGARVYVVDAREHERSLREEYERRRQRQALDDESSTVGQSTSDLDAQPPTG